MAKGKSGGSAPGGSEKPVGMLQWMLLQFLMVIPIIGLVAIFVFAFVGQNRTRKNYFRATLVWLFLILGLHIIAFIMIFSGPTVDEWWKQVFQWCKEVWDAIADIFPKSK